MTTPTLGQYASDTTYSYRASTMAKQLARMTEERRERICDWMSEVDPAWYTLVLFYTALDEVDLQEKESPQ